MNGPIKFNVPPLRAYELSFFLEAGKKKTNKTTALISSTPFVVLSVTCLISSLTLF